MYFVLRMDRINFVIPMAGLSRRFAEAGITRPKYMLEAGGRTLFEHSLASLPLGLPGRVVLVALAVHEAEFKVKAFIEGRMRLLAPGKSWELVLLAAPTRGQAETALAAEGAAPASEGLAVYNIDTGFSSSTLERRLAGPELRRDGVIGCFRLTARDPKWSFAVAGPDGAVTRTAEKEQISENALTGLYHFSRASDFYGAARRQIAAGQAVRGEFYIAPMYNELIAAGGKFVLDTAETLTPLGTPEDLERLRGER